MSTRELKPGQVSNETVEEAMVERVNAEPTRAVYSYHMLSHLSHLFGIDVQSYQRLGGVKPEAKRLQRQMREAGIRLHGQGRLVRQGEGRDVKYLNVKLAAEREAKRAQRQQAQAALDVRWARVRDALIGAGVVVAHVGRSGEPDLELPEWEKIARLLREPRVSALKPQGPVSECGGSGRNWVMEFGVPTCPVCLADYRALAVRRPLAGDGGWSSPVPAHTPRRQS